MSRSDRVSWNGRDCASEASTGARVGVPIQHRASTSTRSPRTAGPTAFDQHSASPPAPHSPVTRRARREVAGPSDAATGRGHQRPPRGVPRPARRTTEWPSTYSTVCPPTSLGSERPVRKTHSLPGEEPRDRWTQAADGCCLRTSWATSVDVWSTQVESSRARPRRVRGEPSTRRTSSDWDRLRCHVDTLLRR